MKSRNNPTRLLVVLLLALCCLLDVIPSTLSTPPPPSSQAAVVEGRISFPGFSKKHSMKELRKIKIEIDGGVYSGFARMDGSFRISGVLPGEHLMEIFSPTFKFNLYRLEIIPSSSSLKVKASVAYFMDGIPKSELRHPLAIEPVEQLKYFKQREPFRPTDLLKNPMAIMMLVTVGLVFVMPKLTADLTEEEKKELEASNPLAKLQQAQNSGGGGVDFADFFAKNLGGSSSTSPSKKQSKKK